MIKHKNMKNIVIRFALLVLFAGCSDAIFAQTCEEKLSESQGKIDLLEDLRAQLEFRVQTKEADIKRLTTELEALNGQIDQLQEELEGLKSGHKKAIDDLKDEHKKELEDQREGVRDRDDELRKKDREINKLKQDLSKEERKNRPLKNENKRLNKKVDTQEEDLKKKKEELTTIKREKKQLENDIRDWEKKYKGLDRIKSGLEEEKKQWIARQQQHKNEIQSLGNVIKQKDNVITQLEPLKKKILEDVATGITRLYQSSPAEGKQQLSGLEKQFELALGFKDATDVQGLKQKFEAYKQQLSTINNAQELLRSKYNALDNQRLLGQLAQVNIPVFQQDKVRLTNLLQGYCGANNKIVSIFNSVHGVGSKDVRTAVLQNSLLSISFKLDDYPFLEQVTKDKQSKIIENTMPGGITTETCPN
jgi:DNA repair exonuclease SbcCD ATPase subunit